MNRIGRWILFAAPLLLALVLVSRESQARPGGGNTYRGSSSSSSSSRGYSSSSSSSRSYSSSSSYSGSSSSGSSDPGGYICLFFGLVVAVVTVKNYVDNRNAPKPPDWSTTQKLSSERKEQARERLNRLRTEGPAGPDGRPIPFDPDFSQILFEDFLYALYARVHEARGGGRLDTMAAYLSTRARQTLRVLGEPERVHGVVVGAMQYLSTSPLSATSQRISVRVRFESNYTEESASGAARSYYVAEEWTLTRSTKAKSRSPQNARVFKCPNCGAPLEGMQGNTCAYCQKTVNTGEFDWVVDGVSVVERKERGPQLTGDTPEEGTDLPTVKQPRADERLGRLLTADPALTWEALEQRLGLIFRELQVAWSNREWERARPYVSDSLFQMQLYWMETYKRAGLRNVTENARITRVELARVTVDRYYVALTVRLFATGMDYTVRDSDGMCLSGSQRRERRYSEYWTLIRGTRTRGKPSADKRCPSCGAALTINMAGNCTHCSAKVTSGDFDWVLSRIEQDESYQG
ncbi:TIM44-like domain-containing protein [Archangium violaceum]|uniref:TIM44-like domain-containing protein n=1 Tax=Archangium violaceum TaxID=83451 RepID=UPI00193C7F01|nr:TIM44-like domain-containing protein [Archangium violaceum]QRK10369.1 TIM44-like domain-containing protein [Archangium violaceum]